MAMTKTKRRKRAGTSNPASGLGVVDFLRGRLTSPPDPRSHAEFVAQMRAKQAAGKLTNPGTTSILLDRLERTTKSHAP